MFLLIEAFQLKFHQYLLRMWLLIYSFISLTISSLFQSSLSFILSAFLFSIYPFKNSQREFCIASNIFFYSYFKIIFYLNPYKRNNYKYNNIIYIQMINILFYFIILFIKSWLFDSTMTITSLFSESFENYPSTDELPLLWFSICKSHPGLAGRAHIILELHDLSWSLKSIEFPVLIAHFCKVSRLLVPTYFLGFMTIGPFLLEDHP